jgi:soluble lytic murein transglycosylase
LGAAWLFRFELAYWRYYVPVRAAAERYRVPPHLVAALIWRETRFQPYRRGPAGELGMMQILPASAGEWAKAERLRDFRSVALFDPATNILAGTWYLGRALDRWSSRDDPVPYALAEYNAGRSTTIRWAEDMAAHPSDPTEGIGYPTTQRYVRAIIARYRAFGKPWQLWF